MIDSERLHRVAPGEECRCGHPFEQHDDEGECLSLTTSMWPFTLPTPCGCDRFHEPDSDD